MQLKGINHTNLIDTQNNNGGTMLEPKEIVYNHEDNKLLIGIACGATKERDTVLSGLANEIFKENKEEDGISLSQLVKSIDNKILDETITAQEGIIIAMNIGTSIAKKPLPIRRMMKTLGLLGKE